MKTSQFRIDFTPYKDYGCLIYEALDLYCLLFRNTLIQLDRKLEYLTDINKHCRIVDNNIFVATPEGLNENAYFLDNNSSYLDELFAIIFNNLIFYQLRSGEPIYERDKYFKQNLQASHLIETNENILKASINVYNSSITRSKFESFFRRLDNSGKAPDKIIVSDGKQPITIFDKKDLIDYCFPDTAFIKRAQRNWKPNLLEKVGIKLIETVAPVAEHLEDFRREGGIKGKIVDVVLPQEKTEEEQLSPKNLAESLIKGTIRGITGGLIQ